MYLISLCYFLFFSEVLELPVGPRVDSSCSCSCSLKACVVQPKSEMDLQFESTKLSTPWGYFSALLLCVATFGTIALTSGFFLKPNATFDDYLADVVPLFGGFIFILGVSEVCYSTSLLNSTLHLLSLYDSEYHSFNYYFQLILFVWINNSLWH